MLVCNLKKLLADQILYLFCPQLVHITSLDMLASIQLACTIQCTCTLFGGGVGVVAAPLFLKESFTILLANSWRKLFSRNVKIAKHTAYTAVYRKIKAQPVSNFLSLKKMYGKGLTGLENLLILRGLIKQCYEIEAHREGRHLASQSLQIHKRHPQNRRNTYSFLLTCGLLECSNLKCSK